MPRKLKRVAVIGAGPAGLTAAWELLEAGIEVVVLERRDTAGGLGGTTAVEWQHGTYRFDFGGHRFITHNPSLLALVEKLVGDDLLTAIRRSVIRLGGRTYDYPLALPNILRAAPWSMLAGASADLLTLPFARRGVVEENFASWIESRFGRTLYRHFFAGYTAKLWGIDPECLSADWAEQRISLMDLKEVARLLLPAASSQPRTYARSYRYPKLGFGMIFERLLQRLLSRGAEVRFGADVVGLHTSNDGVTAVVTEKDRVSCDAVISTIPLPAMVRLTGGESTLRFRGLRFFNLAMAQEDVSPNTWQYLSDPHLLATRLQEPKRRSPFMAPKGHTSLMLEIPCDPGQWSWEASDAELYSRIQEDLGKLGIDTGSATGEYFSTRSACAYPLLAVGYERARDQAIRHLSSLRNLVQCGRQGTFRYVFTDTAMEMGQLAARGIIEGRDNRDRIYEHRNERTVIECQSVA